MPKFIVDKDITALCFSFKLRPEERTGSNTIGWENLGAAGFVVIVVVEAMNLIVGGAKLGSSLCCTDIT